MTPQQEHQEKIKNQIYKSYSNADELSKGGPGSGRRASIDKHKLLVQAHQQAKGIHENFQKNPPKDYEGKTQHVEAENRVAKTRKELREHSEKHYDDHKELLDTGDHSLNEKMKEYPNKKK